MLNARKVNDVVVPVAVPNVAPVLSLNVQLTLAIVPSLSDAEEVKLAVFPETVAFGQLTAGGLLIAGALYTILPSVNSDDWLCWTGVRPNSSVHTTATVTRFSSWPLASLTPSPFPSDASEEPVPSVVESTQVT